MTDIAVAPKRPVFGVGVNPTTYAEATAAIIAAAREHRSLGMSALATHGLMEAVNDPAFGRQVDTLDIVTPDGQPVRWALNALHGTGLTDRVYGPDLTGHVLGAAEREGVSVYLFGSTPETCAAFVAEMARRWPALRVADVQPDRFRDATPEEDAADVARMTASGAGLVLVGRGCPRQEKWVAAHLGRVPAAMMAVGAAFDYYAGSLRRPPAWMQQRGLEWLWRLGLEPRRLFKRYAVTNTQFLLRFAHALVAKRLGQRASARR